MRTLAPLATELETADAAVLDAGRILGFEHVLTRLSNAIGDRFFLQGANAVPTAKLGGLA